MNRLGFERCPADGCIFLLAEAGNGMRPTVVHNDDMFAVESEERCGLFCEGLKSRSNQPLHAAYNHLLPS